jgi:hypothetical protein
VAKEDIVDRQAMMLRGTGIGYVNLMMDQHPDVAINLFWIVTANRGAALFIGMPIPPCIPASR